MTRFFLSLGVSLLAHAALACLLVVLFETFSSPRAIPSLDLSRVELSLSDEDVQEAPPVVQPDAAPEETKPLKPHETARAPMPEVTDIAMPALEMPTVEMPPPPPVPERREALSEALVAAPREARIDAPPRPMRAIRPVYPKGARLRGEEGAVVLELHVTSQGRAEAVRVVTTSGFEELDRAAVTAVKAARFTPAKAGGANVDAPARLTLLFRLK